MVETGADNLEVDEDGSLWIGAHPRLGQFVLYWLGLKRHAPTQVVKVPFYAGRFGEREVIYESEGRELSASTVAAVYKDRLLIGSLHEGVLDCRLGRGAVP